MSQHATQLGSLLDFQKGRVDVIDDDPRHYALSNIFDVAANSRAWEKVAVARNMQYVLETIRAEGTSEWRSAAHDEFALVMDGEVEIRLVKLDAPVAPEGKDGSVRVPGDPDGKPMGRVVARRGHMTLLPANAAYQFHADHPAAILLQTIAGDDTVYHWAEICQTA